MGTVRLTFKKACKHFGIDPDSDDADECLLKALHAADDNKKKRGPALDLDTKRFREACFIVDQAAVQKDFKEQHRREPSKREMAKALVR
jgi:hypothetical protein